MPHRDQPRQPPAVTDAEPATPPGRAGASSLLRSLGRRLDLQALRWAFAPWLVGKLVAVVVVVLVVYGQASKAGHPTLSELRAPFAFWDGQNYTQIADHGYPPGPLDLIPGHPGHLWGFMPGYAL